MLVDIAASLTYVFGIAVLMRAVQNGYFNRYAFFHSYLIYFLVTGVMGWVFDLWIHTYFPVFFWLRFLTLVVAEFALLVQVGDHIFGSFPGLRSLGRLATLGITLVFSIVYILPPLLETRPSNLLIADLVKRSALTKGIILFALAALAGRFRIQMGRNVAGIALGLMTYLAINTTNFALVESLGWKTYYGFHVFTVIGPLSQTLMVLIWAVSLWRYEPVRVACPPVGGRVQEEEEPLPAKLGRYNTALDRVLRR